MHFPEMWAEVGSMAKRSAAMQGNGEWQMANGE